jgi:5-methylthioadenosine/S-adenosylhomocysteine deaminase
MFESMKFAALGQKAWYRDQTLLTAREAFDMATVRGAEALRLDAGRIEEGKLADIILVDLGHHAFVPHHNLTGDAVYSVSGACVHTTICNGVVLMENGKVPGEKRIIREFGESNAKLLERAKEKALE